MINTQYINLNMTPSGVMPVLYCSQNDIGRPLGVVVYNGNETVDLDTYTCTIEATRTDGTAITAAVTTNDNIGAFVTTAIMTNKADKYLAKLVLFDSNSRRVASLAFVMCVTPKTMDENASTIEEDASLYQQYTATVQALIASIRSDLSDLEDDIEAETAARSTAVTTLQNAITSEAAARNSADTSLSNSIAAEVTARTGVDSDLLSAINTESAARASGDASLQSQIDQLVAPSGSAPSAAEVENARVGADGYTYSTLGAAIRGQVTDSDRALASINGGVLFEMGTYKDADGTTKQTSTTRIRTVCPIDVRKIQGIKFSDDYEMWTWCFDENMTKVGNLWGWIPGGFLSCGISPSVKYINFVVRLKSNTSANLTSYLNSFRESTKVITDADCADGIGGWVESGTYADSDGITEQTNAARARVKAPLLAEYIDRIDIPDGFKIYVFFKGRDGTVITTSGWWSYSPDSPETASYTINSCSAGTYIVTAVFKKTDDSAMTAGDIATLNSEAKIHLFDQSYKMDKFHALEKVFRPYQRGKWDAAWRHRISLMHVSDVHLQYTGTVKRLDELVELANYLSDINNGLLPIDLFINTGDVTTGGTAFAGKIDRILLQFDAHKTSIAKLKIPAIGITGNHDENVVAWSSVSDSYITKAQRWSHYYAGFTNPGIVWGNSGNEGYHYFDVTRDGASVRFICLDQLDHPNPSGDSVVYDVMALAVYSQAQINWLCNTALNVPDGYGVVICNHFPFAPQLSDYSHDYAALNDGTFCQGWNMIPEIVQAWVNRTTLNKTYTGSVGDRNITVNANFSAIGSSAQFVCYLCGHTHSKDAFIVQDEYHNSFKQLMLVEDSNGQQGTALNETYKDAQSRMTNCAASVVTIDMRQKKVFRISYGAFQNASTSIVTPQVECYSFDPSDMGQTAESI